MYLIDTSVLINFLKGKENPKTKIFEDILQNFVSFGISAFTYQELLQGAKDKNEFDKLNRYLSTQKIYYPSTKSFENAAEIFFNCRKNGITIRSSIDTLIATCAIENKLILLHDDKDFIQMSRITKLKTL